MLFSRSARLIIHSFVNIITADTWTVRVGVECLKKMSQTSRVPFILEVKNTPGRVGLQQLSVKTVLSYFVHMIGDSLASSDHTYSEVEYTLVYPNPTYH